MINNFILPGLIGVFNALLIYSITGFTCIDWQWWLLAIPMDLLCLVVLKDITGNTER